MTVASGVVVNVHYCMGRIASVGYGYDAHKKCSKCGMSSKKKGCCHTESKLVKVEDAHQLVNANVHFTQLPAKIPVEYFSVQAPVIGVAVYSIPSYHAPPDPRSNHVYLANCVFRV